MERKVFFKVIRLLFFLFFGVSLKIKHQLQQSMIFEIGRGLLDITPKLSEKKLGCNDRMTRQNTIQIQNMFQQNITLRERGTYQSDGVISNPQQDVSQDQNDQPGRYEVGSNHSTIWTFTSPKDKVSNLLAGTSGLMVWEIQDDNGYGVVLFFQNPRVSWNFMGVCIESIKDFPMSGQSIKSQKLQQIFKQLEADQKNWGDNCVLIDNRQRQQLPFFRQAYLNKYGYSITILGKYVYQYNNHDPKCFFQYLIVGIGKQ